MAAIDPGAPARPAVAPRARRASRPKVTFPYLNRELSWLEFNARVLHEARDERNPLLERVKFLAIFAGNLDEFFQVRVAGLRQQVEASKVARSPDGRTADEQLAAVRDRVLGLVADHSAIFLSVRRTLAAEGVELLDYASIPEHHEALRRRFLDEIFPVLTPLAVDPGHPFPYISTLSLSIAVGLRDPETGERGFARVKVPQILPRLLEVEPSRFVLLDQVIEANLDALFSGMEVEEHHLFRVTRNADFEIEEDEADDLLLAIEEELRRRRFGAAVRLEVERSMPAATRALLLRGLGLGEADCYEVSGMLDLTGLWAIADLDRPDLKPVPWSPVTPPRLIPPDEDEPADVFAAIREQKRLIKEWRKEAVRQGWDPDKSVLPQSMPKSMAPFMNLPPHLMDLLEKRMSLSPDQLKVLQQLKYEVAPVSSFAHRFQKKNLVPGYSKDFIRAYTHYMFHGYRYAARAKFMPLLEQAHLDLANSIHTLTGDATFRRSEDFELHSGST